VNAPSLEGRRFRDVTEQRRGDAGAGTVFHYHEQPDGTVWARYAGGLVRLGHLVGSRDGDTLDFRYSHVTTDGVTANGHCRSRIEVGDDGRLRLHERWEWESRGGAGTSTLEELPVQEGAADGEAVAGRREAGVARWLDLVRRTAAIAQAGLHFTEGPYDRERYEDLRTIAAELAAVPTCGDVEAIRGLFAGETGYPTPKVDVRGVVFRRRDILLVRERADGRWTLPGGFADVSDAPAQAVEREVAEEAGIEVRADRLIAVLDRDRHVAPPAPFRTWKLLIRCDVTDGGEPPAEPTTAHPTEITDVGWFGEDGLPPLSVGRTSRSMLEVAFAYLHEPGRPVHLDR
jgi:ADP-ribose pyrophosphatase YjhB (NUDIX family)